MMGYYPATIGTHHFKLNHEHLGFWRAAAKGNWEPETFIILSKFLNPDSLYLDIGAWIGPTVLYAAKRCKKVICFEPDPIAFRHLIANLNNNNIHNVSPFNLALSDQMSIQKMASFGGQLGDSMTSLLKSSPDTSPGFDAFVLDWQTALKLFRLDEVDMVKIDIEGGEFSLIPEMEDYFKKHKPIVWLSLHAPFLEEHERKEKLEKIVEVLSCYNTCLNSRMEPVDIKELQSTECANSYPAYLFMN